MIQFVSLLIFLAAVSVSYAADVIKGYTHFTGNRISRVIDGEQLANLRVELIQNAKSSVYLSTFSISPDEVGLRIFHLLCNKAKEGLEVRLLIDHRSSSHFTNYSEKLRKCGAFTINFNPDDMLYALHQKLLIVDGQSMIMGGSNYAEKYHLASPRSHLLTSKLSKQGRSGWYDADYRIDGPAACGFHYQFQKNFKFLSELWADYTPDLYHYGAEYFRANFNKYYGFSLFRSCIDQDEPGEEQIIPIIGNPYKNSERAILKAHIDSIKQTKSGEEILLYAPYFVPGEEYVRALAEAVNRGVKLKVITNSIESIDESNMGNLIFIGMIESIKSLLKLGAKVYLWNLKSTMHRKGGIYGKVAFFGSDNLDNRGQEYSSESIAFTDSPAIVNSIVEDYQADIERGAVLLTPESAKNIYKKSLFLEKVLGMYLRGIL